MTDYYNKDYFAWQKKYGEFGGSANLIKFAAHIKPTDNVIDFGCGGGYLLKNIECRSKVGIEINPAARKIARENGIKVHASLNAVPEAWANVIISNHVLEHVEAPLDTLRLVYKKVKHGGKVVFVVPCERYTRQYTIGETSQHLYTWSPLNLGNLFAKAGFEIEEVKEFAHTWPKNYLFIDRVFGRTIFNILARIKAHYMKDFTQIRVIATKQ